MSPSLLPRSLKGDYIWVPRLWLCRDRRQTLLPCIRRIWAAEAHRFKKKKKKDKLVKDFLSDSMTAVHFYIMMYHDEKHLFSSFPSCSNAILNTHKLTQYSQSGSWQRRHILNIQQFLYSYFCIYVSLDNMCEIWY